MPRPCSIISQFNMTHLRALFGTMRLPFLILTPACVAVGVGTVYASHSPLNALPVFLVLFGALASHMCVNTFNEYFDFKSGLDAMTSRTPFSGGSGTLPAQPELASQTLLLSLMSLAVAAAVGIYFIDERGWGLMPLGLFGLFMVVSYTTWWTHHPLLCLFAPGLGFGILMVMGTHFALTGTYSLTAFSASLLPTFFVNNLLLLNQFPDIEADKRIGRNHVPILLGREKSAQIFVWFLMAAYASVAVSIALSLLPNTCALLLLTTPLAWKTAHGVLNNANDTSALLPFLGMNVALTILTPVLLSIGLFLA